MKAINLTILALACAFLALDKPAHALDKRTALLLDRLENGTDYKIRLAAAMAIGKLRDQEAVPRMVAWYDKEDNYLVKIAIIQSLSLARTIDSAIFLLDKGQSTYQPEVLRAIETELGKLRDLFNARDWADALSAEGNASLRATIAWVLGFVGAEDSQKILLGALGDGNQLVQQEVIKAIAHLHILPALPTLESLKDRTTDAKLRKVIFDAITQLRSPSKGSFDKIEIPSTSQGILTYAVFKRTKAPSGSGYSDRLNSALGTLGSGDTIGSKPQLVALKTETAHDVERAQKLAIEVIDEENDTVIRQVPFEEFRPVLKNTINSLAESCRAANADKLQIWGDLVLSFALNQQGQTGDLTVDGAAPKRNADFKKCLAEGLKKTLFRRIPRDMARISYTLNIAKSKEKTSISF